MERPFRVLSIDGGGMRGVYTAAYLAGLVAAHAKVRGVESLDLGKGFDLIVGTSTGAIVGCAALAGVPMNKVVDLYCDHGPAIFPLPLRPGLKAPLQLFRKRYLRKGTDALRGALKETLGDRTIASVFQERSIAFCAPAVEMGQQRAWVFKTPHLGGHRDDGYTLVDVCMATTAAPIFRSLAAIPGPDGMRGHQVFADGGLWANNPVLVGLTEALRMTSKDRTVEIYCLGTCPRPEGEQIPENDVHRGLWGWRFGARAAQVSISAQEFAYDHMARMLAGAFMDLGRPIRIVRFPHDRVPASILKYLDIDDSRPAAMKALINQARADVDLTRSACDAPNDSMGQAFRSLLDGLPVVASTPADAPSA